MTQLRDNSSSSDLFEIDWLQINWKSVNRELTSLRRRIFQACRMKKYKSLRSIQRLLFFSKSNILFSIRKVTSINSGSLTPGYDSLTYTTDETRAQLFKEIQSMDMNDYNPIPVKRIYVPKPDGRLRPIGIPTIKDRVIQQMTKNALEPEWETVFESGSYGFRPERSTNDAINRLYVSLSKENCRPWVVEGDIVGCFDNIDHSFLMGRLKWFPFKHLIEKWLNGGIIYDRVFFETQTGTPQGSIISPLLCNIAMHGMEKELGISYNSQGYVNSEGRSLVRYADDFVVLCHTKEDATLVTNELNKILAKRGLILNNMKTKISHICEGFDFLGFNIKIRPKDGYKIEDVLFKKDDDWVYIYCRTQLIISPSEKSINKFKSTLKNSFMLSYGSNAAVLINSVNPIIRGWANSKIHWHSNRTFHKLDHYIYNLCWRWMKRSHPTKSNGWLKSQYFRRKSERGFHNNWVFTANTTNKYGEPIKLEMLQLKWFKPSRYTMIRLHDCPDDPFRTKYFRYLKRIRALKKRVSTLNRFDSDLAFQQDDICPVCGESLFNGEKLHRHHIVSRADGGESSIKNLILLHLDCHRQVHLADGDEAWALTFINSKSSLPKKSKIRLSDLDF
jgi:RNA-directed DNA polymerase